MPASGSAAPAICPRCRHDILPQLAQPSWHREKHRASATERDGPSDPRADTIKRRKDARKLRRITRVQGILAAARVFFEIKGIPHTAEPISEDCPHCLKLQGAA